MPVDKLIDPTGASGTLIAILVGSLVAMSVILLVGMWYFHRDPVRRMKLHAPSGNERDRWIRRIDDVVARHWHSADEQARELHIELAAELRAILSERAGMDVRAWQPSHLRRVGAFEKAADAISSWEEPSFAPYARADIPRARDRAVEAVLAW
ncbi:hypothetical protein J2S70_001074 [Trueperella bonasi]|uniref:DUF4129 domain-containing protein n=1 Tax=Trueperella bonasi TaxID=312286 RepID=A0ABT9NGF9_9ACTO|nr:hypothetical protein [Trueperella bonasi]MDP9806492.1 hypothetical protein [Trueperella bonasi]